MLEYAPFGLNLILSKEFRSSVSDADSNDRKTLVCFPGNPNLEILTKKIMRRLRLCAWAESHVKRSRYLILLPADFAILLRVGILDFGKTYAILTPVKSIKHVIAFPLNVSQRPHIFSDVEFHEESNDV